MFSNSLFVIIRLFQLVIHNKDDSMNRKTKQNDIFSKKNYILYVLNYCS